MARAGFVLLAREERPPDPVITSRLLARVLREPGDRSGAPFRASPAGHRGGDVLTGRRPRREWRSQTRSMMRDDKGCGTGRTYLKPESCHVVILLLVTGGNNVDCCFENNILIVFCGYNS